MDTSHKILLLLDFGLYANRARNSHTPDGTIYRLCMQSTSSSKCPPLPFVHVLVESVCCASIFSLCLCLYLRFHHQRARIWQMYILLCTGDTLSPNRTFSPNFMSLFPFCCFASCHQISLIHRNGVKPKYKPAAGIVYRIHWYTPRPHNIEHFFLLLLSRCRILNPTFSSSAYRLCHFAPKHTDTHTPTQTRTYSHTMLLG